MDFGSLAFALLGHVLASFLYVLRRLNLVDGAVVDSSSILEHREELRDLWEKRMMADDQSSSPSIAVEVKLNVEEETEEKVVKVSEAKTENSSSHKLSNGFAKPLENNNDDIVADKHMNGNAVQMTSHIDMNGKDLDADIENNNSADSLDEDDYVEEVTYTSKLEHTLVVQQQTVVKEVITENVVHVTSTVEESVDVTHNELPDTEVVIECKSVETTQDSILSYNESETCDVMTTSDVVTSSHDVSVEKEGTESSDEIHHHEEDKAEADELHEVTDEKICESSAVAEGEIKDVVAVEESKREETASEVLVEIADDTPSTQEEIDEAFKDAPLDIPEYVEENNNMEEPNEKAKMEELVKGGLKRVLSGVQQTEQPYNTCTTETKIAMEIREMREREEELRLMREQVPISPLPPKVSPTPSTRSPSPSPKEVPGPGYRVSSVFGHKGTTSPSPPVEDDKKTFRGFSKESAVEKEIRLARDREEELRKQKGLPPREDDSYVKPSQVKSSQVRVFSKMTVNNSTKQAATAKIQLEIEEQTQREMALRESGNIQTISQERTDSKVAKLKELNLSIPEVTSPTFTNGNISPLSNGSHTNGHSSPETNGIRRSTPSPTGIKGTVLTTNGTATKSNISMQKFIASRGKETTFSAPKNGPFQAPKEETGNRTAVPPPLIKLKRNVSVESKIQQEILEMKQREEELRKLHMNEDNENSTLESNGIEHEMNQKNNLDDYENGNGINDEEISPRHNKLIAQWEQRIQKAES